MADDSELTLKDPATASKKKLIIMAVIVLVLLIGGGVAAWLLLSGGDEASKAQASAQADGQAQDPATLPALYVGMPRPFVFNVAGQSRDRLVQIKVQLMVRGAPSEALAKQHVPLIEGTLLRVFSAASAEQLVTFEGKEKLRNDSLEECRRVLKDLTSSPVIEQVLFTGFVMQ
ncbi:flagellar basal body-associated protein FliL [Aeromonas molluscorum]|jgi:flagellar protein FliL|uniref:Flagellar protein FliL n=1 Tax=Aeromonas molluscorum 848 TaxID=1268236 RepID=R1F6C5_9GAMM|nr:flagellar basal body-associated protein FliL [Aeromonas molluscorum]EOD55322.1 flagellar basal body-associated protein FliL [Aeromonas molluscorum 848]